MANSSFRAKARRPSGPPLLPAIVVALVAAVGIFSLPTILAIDLQSQTSQGNQAAFPVTVDPQSKTITYNPQVEQLLARPPTQLDAAVGFAGFAHQVFQTIAIWISNLPVYRSLAGTNTLFVTIQPGYRQEQVADQIGNTLHWTSSQKRAFLKAAQARNPQLAEGEFEPGTYFLSVTDPFEVEGLLHARFQQDILDRYSTSTAQRVPLAEAMTVASLIERESGGWGDMRLISGIIWNRLFADMNLQIDATLQYAKADTQNTRSWWPQVLPADKNIHSPYNTYAHPGLPPTPIAEPSVAAVIAALNPKQTDCLFYFHDQYGDFHCSATYAGHVALLKKYYGQGR